MNKGPMNHKGIVVALALSTSLLAGPAALAAPADLFAAPQGVSPQHAGHDHGAKPDKPKPKPKPDHADHHRHGHHDHGDDSAHASGGYDSHRRHPRNW